MPTGRAAPAIVTYVAPNLEPWTLEKVRGAIAHRLRRVSSKTATGDTQQVDFPWFLGFLEKSLEHRIPPKLSWEAPAASKVILGALRFLPT